MAIMVNYKCPLVRIESILTIRMWNNSFEIKMVKRIGKWNNSIQFKLDKDPLDASHCHM